MNTPLLSTIVYLLFILQHIAVQRMVGLGAIDSAENARVRKYKA